MAQETLVLKLAPAAGRALERRLAREPFEFRRVPHARFSARGEGVVATLYESGKLVVQGASPDLFVARYLEGTTAGGPGSAAPIPPARRKQGACLGTDETGKGDYFGPLVVVGVRLDASQTDELGAAGRVRDSKELGDAEAIAIASEIRRRFPFAIRRLDPPEYNATHARRGNLNHMLADLHVEVIRELAQPGLRVVVDRFARRSGIAAAVADLGVDLEERPRAEDEPAVAAASIVARQEFLAALRELSDEYGMELRKGAGPPAERAARAFVRRFGAAELQRVAKVHFKTTAKIGARPR